MKRLNALLRDFERCTFRKFLDDLLPRFVSDIARGHEFNESGFHQAVGARGLALCHAKRIRDHYVGVHD